ncbi:MAG: MotA/TolQ/ExbB proton channel family protein [Bdellovibrionales bacterium]|jgi:biopolymer transport protein ExbB/TolQ|nr:MotA/TolQ/ExbB proton channel family protein [Bdellovibrionales bacterium]
MTSFIQSISEAFHHGGLLMWSIIPVQIVTLAIMAERVMALYVRRGVGQKKMVQVFEDDIRKGQIDKMMAKAKLLGNEPIAVVALAGAQAAQDLAGKDEVQLRMDEVLLEEQTRLEKRTGFLAMLGNVATLLGLLGTITGMIKSFAAVGSANATEKATLLAAGISEAMNATAYGLIVAVPALVMYAVLQNRTNQLTDDLNKAALKLFIWLTYNFETVTVSGSKRKSN